MSRSKYILWDTRKDGVLRYPDSDTVGILGKLTLDNVYISTYAQYPDGKHARNLQVGEHIKDVKFTLSGGKGLYDIYRVE